MKDKILKNYYELTDMLWMNYSKVKVIDNFDYCESNSYTIFYLNNNESFEKFKDAWHKVVLEGRDLDLCYDDILERFYEKEKDNFDFIELGTLDINTRQSYGLEI